MKTLCIGTKLIFSEPMTRLAYNEYRGWPLPADENGADEGYLVEYLDGGQSNHPNHAGYISWSPAAQHHGAYLKIADADSITGLQPHQLRMLGERAKLASDLGKLGTYLMNVPAEHNLDPYERELQTRQHVAMSDHLNILDQRIARFEVSA